MAVAGDHLPFVPADDELVAAVEAPVAGGQRGHAAPVGVAAADEGLAARLVEAVAAELGHHVGLVVAGQGVPDGVAGQELAQAHAHLGAGAFGQPLGQPQVVRVVVGDDDPRHRPAEAAEDGVPGLAGAVDVVAGVDDRHALAVVEQPQVDVVEGEGQGHPDPVHAGGDLDGLAGGGQGGEGVLEFGGHLFSCLLLCIGGALPAPAKSD